MKNKYFFTLLCLCLTFVCKGQASVETRTYEPGGTMVTMNLTNLIRVAEMSHSNFEEIMRKYDYKFNQNNCYRWQGGGIGELFSICKDPGHSSYIWTSKSEMATKMRDELEPHFKGNSDGHAVYRLAYQSQKYEIFWSDNGPGGVVVLFKRGPK